MTITFDLTADLEARLLEEAARQGVDPGQYITQAVRSRLNQVPAIPRLSAEQSRLLEGINQGLSQKEWDRYYSLIAQRQAGILSESEHAELSATSHRIEEFNARRLELLAELARLRGIGLSELFKELGIGSPPVI